jgi:hypothetical protein
VTPITMLRILATSDCQEQAPEAPQIRRHVVSTRCGWRKKDMREAEGAAVAARKASLPAGRRSDAPVEVVCLALALALLVLAARIASLW